MYTRVSSSGHRPEGKEQVSHRTAIGALAPRPGARFRPPAFRRGEVPRTALLKRLSGCDAPLVTVTAAAGYGKTTLLAQWAERDPRPAAWLTSGDDDADPRELRTSVAAALNDIRHTGSSGAPLLLVVDEADRLGRKSLALLAADRGRAAGRIDRGGRRAQRSGASGGTDARGGAPGGDRAGRPGDERAGSAPRGQRRSGRPDRCRDGRRRASGRGLARRPVPGSARGARAPDRVGARSLPRRLPARRGGQPAPAGRRPPLPDADGRARGALGAALRRGAAAFGLRSPAGTTRANELDAAAARPSPRRVPAPRDDAADADRRARARVAGRVTRAGRQGRRLV